MAKVESGNNRVGRRVHTGRGGDILGRVLAGGSSGGGPGDGTDVAARRVLPGEIGTGERVRQRTGKHE